MHRPHARPRTVLAALPLIAVGLGLSACSDSDAEPNSKAGGSGRTPSTPTLSVSPSPTAHESAVDFARRAVLALDDISLRGQWREFQAMSAPTCVGCSERIDNGKFVERGIKQGLRVEGSPVAVHSLTATPEAGPTESDTVAVKVAAAVPPRSYISPDGKREEGEAQKVEIEFTLRWTADGWMIVAMGEG